MRFSRTRSRDSSSGAWRAISSSKVALASSIIAHSSPFISTPCFSNSAGSTRRASLPSSFRPSESASRLAGSIVSTQTFRPCAAIPVAIAAEVVVLPTPPEPAQMQISLPSRTSPSVGIRRASCESRRAASGPRSGSKRKGRVLTGASTRRRRRASWARWERARPCSESAARAAARDRALLALGQRREPLGLGFGEALGVEAVEVDAVDRDADLVAQVLLQRRRLVDRHLLRQGDDRGAGVLVVGDEAVEASGPGSGSGRPGRCWRRCAASAGSRPRGRWRARRRSPGRTCAPS